MTNFTVRQSLVGLLGAVLTLLAGAAAGADELPGVLVAISPMLKGNDTCLYFKSSKSGEPVPYLASSGTLIKAVTNPQTDETTIQCKTKIPDDAIPLCHPKSAANPAICLDLNDAVPGGKRSASTVSLTPNQLTTLAADIARKLPPPKTANTTAANSLENHSTTPSGMALWMPVLLALAVLALLAYLFPGARKGLVVDIRKFVGRPKADAEEEEEEKEKEGEGEGKEKPQNPGQQPPPSSPGQGPPSPPALAEAAHLIEQIKTQVTSLQESATRLQGTATDGSTGDRPGTNYLLTLLDDDGGMTALPLSFSRQERNLGDAQRPRPGERLRLLHDLLDTVAVKLADEMSQKLADRLSQVVRDAMTIHGGDTTRLIGDIKTATDGVVTDLKPLLAEIAGHAAKLEQLGREEADRANLDAVEDTNIAQASEPQALPEPVREMRFNDLVATPALTAAALSPAAHLDLPHLGQAGRAEDQWPADGPVAGSDAYELALQNLVDQLYSGKRQLNDVIAEAEVELEGAGPSSLISFVDWPGGTPEIKKRAKHVAAVLKTTKPEQFSDPSRAEAALNLFVTRLLGASASVILPRPRQPIDDRLHFLATSRGAATSSRIKTVYWVGLKCGDDPVLPAGVSDRA